MLTLTAEPMHVWGAVALPAVLLACGPETMDFEPLGASTIGGSGKVQLERSTVGGIDKFTNCPGNCLGKCHGSCQGMQTAVAALIHLVSLVEPYVA